MTLTAHARRRAVQRVPCLRGVAIEQREELLVSAIRRGRVTAEGQRSCQVRVGKRRGRFVAVVAGETVITILPGA